MKKWIYKHYKWELYEVIWVARDSESLEEKVVYRALYNSQEFWNNSLWIRTKKMFLEKIEVNSESISRFSYVWNKKYSDV